MRRAIHMKTRVLKKWAGTNARDMRKQHVRLAGWHGWSRWRAARDLISEPRQRLLWQ